jgi:hypothetical protein
MLTIVPSLLRRSQLADIHTLFEYDAALMAKTVMLWLINWGLLIGSVSSSDWGFFRRLR